MIIMGIDQGLASLGFAILDFKSATDVTLLKYGTIHQPSTLSLGKRLVDIKDKLEKIALEEKPDAIACEKLFYSNPTCKAKNRSATIITTNMVTGIIFYLCEINSFEAYSYVPGTVKKVICGNGRARKAEVIKEICSRFTVDTISSKKEHVCDAIAIGITCGANLYEAPDS